MVLAYLATHKGEWIEAWRCVGPKISVIGDIFLSYKAPARLSELYAELAPAGLLDRRKEYKNGAHYYSYNLSPNYEIQ